MALCSNGCGSVNINMDNAHGNCDVCYLLLTIETMLEYMKTGHYKEATNEGEEAIFHGKKAH